MRHLAFVLGAFAASFSVAFGSSTAMADEEVVVRGRTREPSATTLRSDEVRALPGAFGDPFRALEALPGATPMQSGTPYMILRGAPPGNTAILIDGIPVPLLFHWAIGPSVLPVQIIDHIDYWPGGAPARFGRAVGGVISAETKPPENETRFYGQARFFDAGAMVESPFAGGRAHALVAGRFSYTAAALSLFSPGVQLGYSDYQARTGVKLDERNEVSVFAFGSHDRRGPVASFPTTYVGDFHRVDLRFDRALEGHGRLRVAGTLGVDTSGNEQAETSAESARVRMELERPLDETMRLRAGADVSYTHFAGGNGKDPERDFFAKLLYPENDVLVTGAHGDLVWRPLSKIELVPGLRGDVYRFIVPSVTPAGFTGPDDYLAWYARKLNAPAAGETTEVTIDPRLSSRFVVTDDVAIVGTVGRYHQPPSFFAPSPGLQPAGYQRGLQGSYQRSAGVEVAFAAGLGATATVFSHEYRNTTAFTSCGFMKGGFNLEDDCIGQRKNGDSVGLELLVRRSLSRRIGGLVSYTLSRSQDEPVDIQRPSTSASAPVGRTITPFDHKHVFNAVLSAKLGAGWLAGARVFAYTGRPWRGARTDPFFRLDVRIEKRWPILTDGWIAVVGEGLNVTFADEDAGLDCSSGTCRKPDSAPVVLPSLGVEMRL